MAYEGLMKFAATGEINPLMVLLFIILIIWSLVWKGLALWKAGRLNHPVWFIVLLVVNTAGILEILYLYVFSKNIKKPVVKAVKETPATSSRKRARK